MWKAVVGGAAALVLAGTSVVHAQHRSGADDGRRWRPGAEDLRAFGEARLAALKAGLALTAEQRERIRRIDEEMFRGRPGPGGPGGQRRPYDEKRKAAGEQIQALLKEGQKKKWRELAGKPFEGPMPAFFPGPPRPFGPR